jgi:hypothetical protein
MSLIRNYRIGREKKPAVLPPVFCFANTEILNSHVKSLLIPIFRLCLA